MTDSVIEPAEIQSNDKQGVNVSAPSTLWLYFPYFGVILLHALIVFTFSRVMNLEHLFRLGLYTQPLEATIKILIAGSMFGPLIYVFWCAVIWREKQPLTRLLKIFRTHFLNPYNIAAVTLPVLAWPILLSSYTSFKSMIGIVSPFPWDAAFAEWDRFLHFGVDPWRITHAIFGDLKSTQIIVTLYTVWFILKWLMLIGFMFLLNRPKLRHQYMLTMILIWTIMGSGLAFVFSSAGPVYYGNVVEGPDLFAPLMAQLQSLNAQAIELGAGTRVWSLDVQDMLWRNYASGSIELGTGISAMPSLHVAVATLMALGAWRLHKVFGIVMILYAISIQIGSVHLAWHYAIDGYFGALFA